MAFRRAQATVIDRKSAIYRLKPVSYPTRYDLTVIQTRRLHFFIPTFFARRAPGLSCLRTFSRTGGNWGTIGRRERPTWPQAQQSKLCRNPASRRLTHGNSRETMHHGLGCLP